MQILEPSPWRRRWTSRRRSPWSRGERPEIHGTAALTGFALFLGSMGVTLPNPFSALSLPAFEKRVEARGNQEVLGIRQHREMAEIHVAGNGSRRAGARRAPRKAQAGSLSGSAASALLSHANAQLNRVANESSLHQQGLESLANELRRTAAGREAAESLRQGNYDRAAQQLQEIGRKSDQLSAAAKQELADALNRAAASSQQTPDLSRRESAARNPSRRATTPPSSSQWTAIQLVAGDGEPGRATERDSRLVAADWRISRGSLETRRHRRVSPAAGFQRPSPRARRGLRSVTAAPAGCGRSSVQLIPQWPDRVPTMRGTAGGQQSPGSAPGGPALGDQSQPIRRAGQPAWTSRGR